MAPVNPQKLNSTTRELLALSKLREAFELLKRVFTEGGGRSPRLANAIDHTSIALESAGLRVGPPPEFGDSLEFDDHEVLAYLCEFN